MRYIIAILTVVYIGIALSFAVFTKEHRSEIQALQQGKDTIQQEKETLQQENTTLRSEIERMRQESSRGGNRRMMEVTYYTTAADECGKDDGITASGTRATVGRTIAAGPGIPFGTKVYVDGHMYVVEDRGGDITGNRLDILVGSKKEAFSRGRHMAQVVIER